MNEGKNVIGIALILATWIGIIIGIVAMTVAFHSHSAKIDLLEKQATVQEGRIARMGKAPSPIKGPLDLARDAEVYNRLRALEEAVGLRAKNYGTEGKDTSHPDSGLQRK